MNMKTQLLRSLRSLRPRCALPLVGSANRNYAENHSARDFPKSFNVLRFAPNLNDFA